MDFLEGGITCLVLSLSIKPEANFLQWSSLLSCKELSPQESRAWRYELYLISKMVLQALFWIFSRSLDCLVVKLECHTTSPYSLERFSRAGPRGRGREWATLGVHPLSWLLSNNRLEKVPFVSVLHTSSNWLLLSNQDKGCTPSVAHSLPLPLGPALLNLWTDWSDKAFVHSK